MPHYIYDEKVGELKTMTNVIRQDTIAMLVEGEVALNELLTLRGRIESEHQ